MTALLVGLMPLATSYPLTPRQMFKIIVPYIILSVTFAVLNSTLQLPPFSLLLVALTLTDGMTLTFFFQVQDTGKVVLRAFIVSRAHLKFSRFVAGDWTIHQLLLYNVTTSAMVSGYMRSGGVPDSGCDYIESVPHTRPVIAGEGENELIACIDIYILVT